MKIKLEKYVYRTMADINIYRVDCTAQNITKIVDLLNLKNILVLISSVEKQNPFLEKIEELALKYTTSIPIHNSLYVDVVLIAEPNKFKEIIMYALKCNSDGFFIANINNIKQWKQYMYDIKRVNGRKLIKNKLSKVCIFIMIDEYEIDISLDTEVYDVLEMYSNMKRLF